MLTTFKDDSNIPVFVWGDGDIGIAVQHLKDGMGALVSFEQIGKGEVGRDISNEKGPTLLRFLFEKEESLDVLMRALLIAKGGFREETPNNPSE